MVGEGKLTGDPAALAFWDLCRADQIGAGESRADGLLQEEFEVTRLGRVEGSLLGILEGRRAECRVHVGVETE